MSCPDGRVYGRILLVICADFLYIENHYGDVIMSAMAFQITSISIVCWPFVQAQMKENIKAPHYWPFVRGIHPSPINFPHKGPVTRNSVHLMTSWYTLYLSLATIIVADYHSLARSFWSIRWNLYLGFCLGHSVWKSENSPVGRSNALIDSTENKRSATLSSLVVP